MKGRKPNDLTGQRFGRLEVIELIEVTRRGAKWKCKCSCGKETTAFAVKLKQGAKKSCGCLWFRSGRYAGGNRKQSKLEGVLKQMKARCRNPSNKDYRYYGALGVTVCAEWAHKDAFEAWAWANGYKDGLTIDRINGDEGYNPDNCKWISLQENSKKQPHRRRKDIAQDHQPVPGPVSKTA